MSTIDASRDHRASGTPTSGERPSHPHMVLRSLRYASVWPSGSWAQRSGVVIGLVIGSALLAASSAIHLKLWSTGYRTIPTIGPLFLIQGLAGLLLAILVLLSRRLLIVVTAAGFLIATIGGLLLSISFGLFGFMDTLAAPYAGLSLGVESAGAVVFAAIGTVLVRGHAHSDQGTPHWRSGDLRHSVRTGDRPRSAPRRGRGRRSRGGELGPRGQVRPARPRR